MTEAELASRIEDILAGVPARAQKIGMIMPLIRSHTDALIVAAYAAAKEKFIQLANDVYHDRLTGTLEEAVELWQLAPGEESVRADTIMPVERS